MAGVAGICVRQRFNPLNARMNYSHPLAEELVFCGLPYFGVDFMQNRNASVFSGERDASVFGTARRAQWENARTTDMSFTSGKFTLAVASNILGTVSASQPALRRGSYSSESVNTGYEFGYAGTNVSNLTLFRNNGSAFYLFSSSTIPRNGTVIGTSDGTTKKVYTNGLETASSTSANLLPVDSTANVNINFGGSSASIACAWSRILSTNEIAMFTADPYCMLIY